MTARVAASSEEHCSSLVFAAWQLVDFAQYSQKSHNQRHLLVLELRAPLSRIYLGFAPSCIPITVGRKDAGVGQTIRERGVSMFESQEHQTTTVHIMKFQYAFCRSPKICC